jgi:hypothetical protein
VLPTPERKGLKALQDLAEHKKIDHWKEINKYLKGTGFWRQFLVKYYEANNMHKKMLYVRDKLKWLESEWGRDERTTKALREIYKAQVNDPYWHGQFGGVYFAFMRSNIYNYLIEAEKIIEKICEQTGNPINPAILRIDLDKDGRDEVLLETSLITMYVHPFQGGSVFEIDHKEKGLNILNTFQRRKEAYYEEDLDYVVDRWRRYAFFDHFVQDELDIEDLVTDRYEDIGNFPGIHYQVETNQAGSVVTVKLMAAGEIQLEDLRVPVKVSKLFELVEGKQIIRVNFAVENLGEVPIKSAHLTEIPIYLTGDLPSIEFKFDKNASELLEDESFEAKTIQFYAKQNEAKLKISFQDPEITQEGEKTPKEAEKPPKISRQIFKYNLFTHASTNGGFNTLYQGTVIAIKTAVPLQPGQVLSWKLNLTLG